MAIICLFYYISLNVAQFDRVREAFFSDYATPEIILFFIKNLVPTLILFQMSIFIASVTWLQQHKVVFFQYYKSSIYPPQLLPILKFDMGLKCSGGLIEGRGIT